MNLKDILAKKASELSNTEKSFLREHKSELNAEQTTAFASVFDESASRMREIRPSGLEGGVALTCHPYPYRILVERRIYAAERDARRNLACALAGLGPIATRPHKNPTDRAVAPLTADA